MLFIKSKIQFFESKSQPSNGLKETVWVVYQVKDTIFWKQITTKSMNLSILASLFIKSKIQFFESKSQLLLINWDEPLRCLSSQRYNFLKANHNLDKIIPNLSTVVYQVKDTIFWKQITTLSPEPPTLDLLFIKSKIQFFESKSQLLVFQKIKSIGCLSSQRYNFLKANHNLCYS